MSASTASPSPITIQFDGKRIAAQAGDTIAAALASAGIVALGRRRDGSARGLWCGMGVCQECVVTVDGVPGIRACMASARDGACIVSQEYAVRIPEAPAPLRPPDVAVPTLRPQVLIVGGGPAGLAAARAAAACGAKVTVADERASAGGQFWKQRAAGPAIDRQMLAGHHAIADVRAQGVTLLANATVWGAFGSGELTATIDGESHVVAPGRLVLATGVYERSVPLPGWTLPGFMTTGAAQTLLRAYGAKPGRRVLVAGNGPLNWQVAAELVAAGVQVVALVEAAPRLDGRRVTSLLRAARLAPALIAQGLRYRLALRRAGVPVLHATAVVAAHGHDRVEACTVAAIDAHGRPRAGTERRFEVDTVCAGYGFLPANEIARMLGCRHAFDAARACLVTRVDDDGATTVPGVYAIGDAVAMRGAHVARLQGAITGLAVARSLGLVRPRALEREIEEARAGLAGHLAFQAALWQVFDAPLLHAGLATPDTVVCRCEHVTAGAIAGAGERGATTVAAVKRRTRAGMGRCQGRGCEASIASLLPASPTSHADEIAGFAPRVPAKPIAIRDVA